MAEEDREVVLLPPRRLSIEYLSLSLLALVRGFQLDFEEKILENEVRKRWSGCELGVGFLGFMFWGDFPKKLKYWRGEFFVGREIPKFLARVPKYRRPIFYFHNHQRFATHKKHVLIDLRYHIYRTQKAHVVN